MARSVTRAAARKRPLTLDHAVIAVLVAAMEANQHVSRDEAERAHHIIWSMRRFRRKPAELVNRSIEEVRSRMEQDGPDAIVHDAARLIPARLRPSVFAAAVDLMLSDNRMEPDERRFVSRLAAALKVRPAMAATIVRVMLIKNGA